MPTSASQRSHNSSKILNKHYSFANAHKKINHLATLGYVFIGSLPEYSELPPIQKHPMVRYLFTKNNKYYQYKGSSFLLNSESSLLQFDEHNEPFPDGNFSKIIHGNFIYLLIKKNLADDNAPNLIVFLKENVALSGHAKLAGPFYRSNEHIIIGGEIYFSNESILLVNHKSGSFHSEAEKAVAVINEVWGAEGVDAFYNAVEAEEVTRELQRREEIKTANKSIQNDQIEVLNASSLLPEEHTPIIPSTPSALFTLSPKGSLEAQAQAFFSPTYQNKHHKHLASNIIHPSPNVSPIASPNPNSLEEVDDKPSEDCCPSCIIS